MACRPQIVIPLIVALLVAGAAAPLVAAPGASTRPEDLKQQLKEAYGAIKQYQGTARLEIVQKVGRQARTKSGDFTIVLDRDAHKLAVDAPDYKLVADGRKVRLTLQGVADKFVEIDQPETLDYETLASYFQILKNLTTPPELLLLLADNPYRPMGGWQQPEFSSAGPDADGRVGLALEGPQSNTTLWIDPATHRVPLTVVELKGGQVQGGNMSVALNFTARPSLLNKSLPADAFAFDSKGRTAVDSFDALMGRKPVEMEKDEMTGAAAPKLPVTDEGGKQLNLLDGKHDVVVLDFWATWCGPCLMWLPELQKVYDWTKKENLNVAIYAVSLGDKPGDVKKMWDREGLSIPYVFLNDDGAANAWGLQAIPRTAVIVDGKVAIVHTGVSSGAGPQLQQQIKDLLKKKGATSKPAE